MDIIDKLVVTLGLDASGFHRGQKAATKAWSDTKTSISNDAGVMSSAIASVAKEFVGLFIAVRGIDDVIHGFANLNTTLATLGYTARQLGESTGNLRLYQQIAGGFGGTAAGVTQMISGMEQGMFQLRYMGQMSSQMLAWLRFGGGLPATNAQGGIDVLKMVAQLREHLKGISDVDKNQILTALGVSEGVRNAVFATNVQYQKWLDSQRQSAAIMAKGAPAAQSLQRAWRNLGYELSATASQILTTVSPVIKSLFGEMSDWVGRHSSDFQRWLDQFAAWANGSGPKQIATAFDTIATAILDVAKAFGTLPTFATPSNMGAAAGSWTRRMFTTGEAKAEKFMLAPTFRRLESKYHLPAGTLNLLATKESNYNPDAVSSKGARGMFQLNPRYYMSIDPTDDADTAARIFSGLLGEYHGNFQLALAAYNAGPGRVNRSLRTGMPLPAETRAYAPGAMAAISAMHHTSHVQVGNVTIHTRATDASGIAVDFKREMQRKFNVFQADPGLF